MPDDITAAPNAGAPPTVESADASQAATEQSILAAIQANAAGGEKPANEPESQTGDDLANPFASTGEEAQPEPEPEPEAAAAEEQPFAAEPEAQPEATEGAEQTSESARQLINKSNIDPALKKELSDDVFRARRFKELGFNVETAEAFKDLGVTPEVIIERTNLHPTLEDARRDAGLAATMRQIAEDLGTNPAGFLEKVGQANPAMAKSIKDAVRAEITSPEDLGEEVWFPFVQQSTWNLLDNLDRAATAEQNSDLKEAVSILRAKVFGQGAVAPQPRQPAPAADDANNRLRKELEQLRAEKARQESTARGSWESSMQQEGLKAVGELAVNYLSSQGVSSLPGTFGQDAVRELAMSVLGAISSDPRLAADANVFLKGPMTQERFKQGLDWLKSRAAPLINVHGQRVREKYRPLASARSATAPQTAPKPAAAPRPDVARPSGATPRPAAAPSPTQAVFAAAKKGMSIEQMIAANSAARGARRR